MKKPKIISLIARITLLAFVAGTAGYAAIGHPAGHTRPVAMTTDGQKNAAPSGTPSQGGASKTEQASRPAASHDSPGLPDAHAVTPVPVIQTTPTEIVTADGTRYPLRHYTTAAYNDPHATQWWTTTTNLQALWDLAPTGPYVPTIAIIDTGFALAHDELAGRWALNASDPVNGIDDDGNGYTDDWRGWDFAYGDNDPQAGTHDPGGDGTTHGTMTAGAAAATGNNGHGIAGVSQTAKILPVQVMDDDASGTSVTVARGIVYAADRHADVISISLGTDAEDPYLRQAVDYAITKGSVVVASAGNSGCDCLAYPARYPEVVAVGSVGRTGSPSGFSSYGANLDLLAPGEDMILPAWSTTLATNGYVSGAAGTSFSAPLVSGTIASLKALSPASSGGEIIAALKETADHKTLTLNAPHSPTLGSGVLDAGAAATRLTTAQTSPLRYFLGSSLADALDSARVYDCQNTVFPSAELFEIDNGILKTARYTYTISDLSIATATARGQAVRSLGYQCVGQAVDRPLAARLMNLDKEIH